MGLQYVVAKRIFGFDKDKNVKYVAVFTTDYYSIFYR